VRVLEKKNRELSQAPFPKKGGVDEVPGVPEGGDEQMGEVRRKSHHSPLNGEKGRQTTLC